MPIKNVNKIFFLLFTSLVSFIPPNLFLWKGASKYLSYLVPCTAQTSPSIPLSTERKLNLHETTRRRSGCSLNVMFPLNLHPVSRGLQRFKRILRCTFLKSGINDEVIDRVCIRNIWKAFKLWKLSKQKRV